MSSIVIEVKTGADKKLLLELAERLGLKSKTIDAKDMEDLFLGEAISKARKGDFVEEAEVMYALKKSKK